MQGKLSAPERSDTIQVWLGRPDGADLFDASTLSAADRERFTALRDERRREEFKVSRALGAQARSLNLRAQARSSHAQTLEPMATSLTHSGGYAALSLAPAAMAVGIDLELYRPRDVLRLARIAFTDVEIELIERAQGAQRERSFYALWTMKEAFAKALQLPLADALCRCAFTPHESGGWSADIPSTERWFVSAFEPEPGMCLAVACVGDDGRTPMQFREWPPTRPASWPVIARAAAPHALCRAAAAAARAAVP